MAKSQFSLKFCANTVKENERMLQESHKNEIDIKNKDYKRLFAKLNYFCQAKSTKEQIQLNPCWYNKNITSYTYGPINGFPSGSWWGIRMDCSRDCVHDPFDEDVQDGPFGVTSICTSGTNQNEDVDLGTSLTITGEKYVDGNVDPLVKNYESQVPVRLIRSYNLLNKYAPKTGYRYDGLYLVTSFWIGINPDSVKLYKFSLARVTNQEPLSCGVKELVSTTNVPSTSMPSPDNSNGSIPNVHEFNVYSRNLDSVAQKESLHDNPHGFPCVENKRNHETERVTSESAIVTRHVFKKVNPIAECTLNVPGTSTVSENKNKLITHIGSQASKAHSTNISIRTGLYDSSHSAQNGTKKNTLSPFSRTAKSSLNVLKNSQHVENWSSPVKDKGLKGLDSKCTSNDSSKRVNYTSANTVKLEPVKLTFSKDAGAEGNVAWSSSSPYHGYECNQGAPKEMTNDRKGNQGTGNSLEATTNMLKMTNCMYKNETWPHKPIVPRSDQESKVLDSLDLLTPDRILHLIKNKDNPLSKLLMGNMIGLTAEQTIALETGNGKAKVESEMKEKMETNTDDKDRTNFEVAADDLIGSRCYKFRRRKRLPRKIINKPDTAKYSKVYNKMLNDRSALSFDHLMLGSRRNNRNICKDAKQEAEQNRVVENSCETNCLLDSARNIEKKVGNGNEKRMKPSNSSPMKKHRRKKQRREITNLLIDAKITPKLRGPRYRRLRAHNENRAKSSCKRYDTNVCTLRARSVKSTERSSSFRNRSKLARIVNCKRVKGGRNDRYTVDRSERLNAKRDTVNGKAAAAVIAVSTKTDDGSNLNRLLSTNSNENANENENDNLDNNDDNKKKSSKFTETIRVKSIENKNRMLIKNQKRRLIQTVYREPKCRKIEEELKNGYESEISTPYKADAVTQCSLIKEPLIRNVKPTNSKQNNARSEQHIFIRIEYGEFKDMKSELCESMKSANGSKTDPTFKSNEKYMPCGKPVYNIQRSENARVSLNDNNIFNANGQNNCSPERVSAFVPVNIPDNDVKIARLRSIGFKPIDFSNNDQRVDDRREKVIEAMKRNVAEKYDKYTNEESDIVVYMDDELQYQDIENEDVENSSSSKRKMPMDTADVCAIKEERLSATLENESLLELEQELESPWHGWRKVVTNEETYWVGW